MVTPAVTPTPGPLAPLQPVTSANAYWVQPLAVWRFSGFLNQPVSRCSVSFSPDGTMLMGACGSVPVVVWEVASGSPLFTLDTGYGRVTACAFDLKGERIACGGEAQLITLWDGATGGKLQEFAGVDASVRDLSFTADSGGLITCGSADGLHQWNTTDGSEVWHNPLTAGCLGMDISPDGMTIAYGSDTGAVGMVDTTSGEILQEWPVAEIAVEDVAFSSSGRLLAVGSADNLVRIIQAKDGFNTSTWRGHYHAVKNLLFSADDTLLVTSGLDNTIRIWGVEKGVMLKVLHGHDAVFMSNALSPDGSIIATIGVDGTVRLWGVPRE